jgi:hypothetical protein
LIEDFVLVGQKLEQLGFTYFEGVVMVIDPADVQCVCLRITEWAVGYCAQASSIKII